MTLFLVNIHFVHHYTQETTYVMIQINVTMRLSMLMVVHLSVSLSTTSRLSILLLVFGSPLVSP
ncbi:hypothetical protein M8C21_031016 [Ambrosia artemisiifolia]|uniref:Uncharacterized protein n=1 Tax=Ambrosia artemisiifolia TaxID=4212 RepID=A0AAD5BMM8_AMBAR|nr:hypothetical protein M8C21_031016 [Ambrosia artemisiifolia]